MKRIGFIRVFLLALAVGFGLLIVTADRREREAVDLLRPTTLLRFVANRLHALPPYVNKRIDSFTASFRETIGKHEDPKKSLER